MLGRAEVHHRAFDSHAQSDSQITDDDTQRLHTFDYGQVWPWRIQIAGGPAFGAYLGAADSIDRYVFGVMHVGAHKTV